MTLAQSEHMSARGEHAEARKMQAVAHDLRKRQQQLNGTWVEPSRLLLSLGIPRNTDST